MVISLVEVKQQPRMPYKIMCSKLQQPHGVFFIRQSPPSAPSHYDLLVITPEIATSPFLQPGAEVGGVTVRIVGDATLGHQEDARELGPQLFLGIVEISKSVALIQGLAVEPLGGARPVTTFVKGGPVIVPRRLEGRPWRKVNGVGHGIVEGAIGLVMTDAGAAVTQQGLCSFDGLPLLAHPRRVSRNPVDLTCVENRVDAV